MGSSTSTIATQQVIKSFTQILNTYNLKCYTTNINAQYMTSNNCKYDIRIGNDLSQMSTLDTVCQGNVTAQSATQSDLSDAIDDAASALKKGFGLGSSNAEILNNLLIELQNQVINDFNASVEATQVNLQGASCNNTGLFLMLNNTMTQSSEQIISMTFEASSNSTAASNLSSFLENEASSTTKGGGWLAIIIVSIVVLILFMFGIGFKVLLTPSFWFLVGGCAAAIFGYFTFAYLPTWWPYQRVIEDYTITNPDGTTTLVPGDTDEEIADKQQSNKTTLAWMGAVFGVSLIFEILMVVASVLMGGFGGESKKAEKAAKEQQKAAKAELKLKQQELKNKKEMAKIESQTKKTEAEMQKIAEPAEAVESPAPVAAEAVLTEAAAPVEAAM